MLSSVSAERIRPLLRNNRELVVLLVVTLGVVALPGHIAPGRAVPAGIVLFGLSKAGILALQATGLVLVYRSNRIINFAQGALGALSGYLFFNIVTHGEIPHLLGYLGVPVGDNATLAPYPYQVLNIVVGLIASLALSLGVGLLVYYLVIRWFDRVPPLTVTVASIGLAYLVNNIISLPFLQSIWPKGGTLTFNEPFDVVLSVGSVTLHIHDLLAIMVGPLAVWWVARFLRRSAVGTALRASASNSDRARTLGIPVANVTSVAWVLAALLSGIAAVLVAPNNTVGLDPSQGATGFPPDVLVGILAVGVVARMRSLPLVVVGAVCLGIVQESLQWNFSSDAIYQGFLLVFILVFLLLRRERGERADVAEETFAVAQEARPTPVVMRRFPTVRKGVVLLVLLGAAVTVGLPWVMPPDQVNAATAGLIYAMIGLSLLVLTGWAGQISLGQLAFAGIGAFMSTLLGGTLGLPMIIAVVLGAASGALVATVVGIPALRLPGLNLAVVTLALAIAVSTILLNPNYAAHPLPNQLARPGLLGLDLENETWFYYTVLVVLAIVTVVVLGLRRSTLARALIAARDNPHAAQSFAVNMFASRLKAFAISGFIAGLAGALYAFEQHGVHAASYGADQNLNIFLVAIVGGLGSVLGPILGAAANFLLPLTNIAIIKLAGIPILALFFLLIYPSGLSGMTFAARDWWLRRIAVRNRIDVPSLFQGRNTDRRHARAPLAPRRQQPSAAERARYRIANQWGKSGPIEEVSGGG